MKQTRTTQAQEKRFYREVVQASLETFYGKSHAEVKTLVRDWWKRLSESGVLKSEILLHDDPINTAAGIADTGVIEFTSKNLKAYQRIEDETRDVILARAKSRKSVGREGAQVIAASAVASLVQR